jgi:transposase-like protein
MPGRTFTREFKLDIVRQIENGLKRPAQLCREHHLDHSVLTRWRREFQERGDAAFTAKQSTDLGPMEALEARIAELERHCGQLSLENSVLKKLVTRLPSKNGTP